MSLEEAKQFLRAEPTEGSGSLYDHLSQVLLKIIIDRPKDANQYFEEISAQVRSGSFVPPAPPKDEETEEEKDGAATAKQAQLAWVGTQKPMFDVPTEEPPAELVFQNLVSEANLWEAAGISLGRSETYRVQLALKQLAIAKEKSVRFWGKIVTRSGDYFVAETKTAEEPPEAEGRFNMEGLMGPNKYTYYVCKGTGPVSAWAELPMVTPKQLVVARQIKRFFSGDLEAPICSFPPFPGDMTVTEGAEPTFGEGKEKHLLRAQIALITAEGLLTIKDTLEVNEEAGEEEMRDIKVAEPEDPLEPVSLEDLKDSASWQYAELDINVFGRAQKTPFKEDEEGEPIMPEGFEEPERPDLLRPLGDEALVEPKLWVLRTSPDGAGTTPDAMVIAKSLKWPGAVAVAQGASRKVTNIYVGFGTSTVRSEAPPKPYAPPMPKEILKEWVPPEEEEDFAFDKVKGVWNGGKPLIEAEDVIVEPKKEDEEEE